MRRQRRMAELQDKQDRQRMGLLPPDPPKGNPPPPFQSLVIMLNLLEDSKMLMMGRCQYSQTVKHDEGAHFRCGGGPYQDWSTCPTWDAPAS